MFIRPCIIVIVEEWKTNVMLLAILSYVLNMFRKLIYPSSGACDCVDELPHGRLALSSFCVGALVAAGFRWWSFCRLKPANQPHQKLQHTRTENKTTDVVIHQHSRKLLMMDILMSEKCWAHKKWNKIASDIKLVFHSSTILSFIYSPLRVWSKAGNEKRSLKDIRNLNT